MLLRFGVHFVAARHRANLDPAFLRAIARHQFIKRRLHHQLLFTQRRGQLFDRGRLIRRVNYRFQRRSSLFVRHSVSFRLSVRLSLLCVLCVSLCPAPAPPAPSFSGTRSGCPVFRLLLRESLYPGLVDVSNSSSSLRVSASSASLRYLFLVICRSSLFSPPLVHLDRLESPRRYLFSSPVTNYRSPITSYLYSSSTCRIAPFSSSTASNALAFFNKISPNCFSCTIAMACSFTISSTARNATIIACREGHASKN